MESREGKEPGTPKPFLTLLLASPRGFCAGVERAIRMVGREIPDEEPIHVTLVP